MEQNPDVPGVVKTEDPTVWLNLKVKNQVWMTLPSLLPLPLKVSSSQSTLEETTFRIKKTAPLQKMMDVYAQRNHLDVRLLRFGIAAAFVAAGSPATSRAYLI